MAAARQKEMNVNITVVATKTLIAGFWRFCMGCLDERLWNIQSNKREDESRNPVDVF